MDKKRFNSLIDQLKADALRTIKLSAPVRTHNLQNSVRVRDLPNGGFEIYIDVGQAPYAPYTIEPWIHGHWNGRENPNEGWTEEAAEEFIKVTKFKLNGKITHKGVNKNE